MFKEMATRGSYVHKSMVDVSGVSRKFSFMQFHRQKIDGFKQKYSEGF